jgi:hypothetical protein
MVVRTQAVRYRHATASAISWGGKYAPKERRAAQGARSGLVERVKRLHNRRNLSPRRRES